MKFFGQCPVCGAALHLARLSCPGCKAEFPTDEPLSPYERLAPEYAQFLQTFLACRGSMKDVQNELATSLPYGKQRRLEIARALATEPTLLLLDEPAAGMNPQETLELAEFIKEIRDHFHKTILLIEHHMDLVMDIADRIYVLDFGKLIAQGTPEEIQSTEHVIDAYLGVVEDAED